MRPDEKISQTPACYMVLEASMQHASVHAGLLQP